MTDSGVFLLFWSRVGTGSVSDPSLQVGSWVLEIPLMREQAAQCFMTCSVWICSHVLSFSFQNSVVQP